MSVDAKKVGEQILSLRKSKNLTQQELGERLNISFQAISKWERGETLPDTALLPDLAEVLETTVDNILMDGAYIDMTDIKKGFTFEHWADTVADFAQKHGIR